MNPGHKPKTLAVLRCLPDATDDETASPNDIAKALGMRPGAVHALLSRAVRDGLAVRVGFARYRRAAKQRVLSEETR